MRYRVCHDITLQRRHMDGHQYETAVSLGRPELPILTKVTDIART